MTDFGELVKRAERAGTQAALDATPRPMIVGQAVGLSDQIDYSKQTYYVAEGVVGFAWIAFAGNTAFGRYMKKTGKASAHYPKGLSVWVSEGGQSYERKIAYAHAYAAVLREAGIEAYAGGRLD